MLRQVCFVFCFSLLIITNALAVPFNQISQIYFFGDSLTDSGFNDLWPTQGSVEQPPLPPGKAPTWTTYGGYIWSQFLARDIKGYVLPVYPGPVPADLITNNFFYVLPPHVPGFVSGQLTGIDYAAGGSRTNGVGIIQTWAPSLLQQVGTYLDSTGGLPLDPNAIYFIWSGANDILKFFLEPGPNFPTQLELLETANNAAKYIGQAAALLSAHGAKRIVVLSLPNLGYTPLIKLVSQIVNQPDLPAQMKTLTFTFNSFLNMELGKVIKRYGTKILYLDIYDLLDNLINATRLGQPFTVGNETFHFVNYTDPACATAPSAIYCPSTAPTGYIFADEIHPTGEAHRLLAVFVELAIINWK